MSAEMVRDLRLVIHYDSSQADAASKAHHSAERARVKDLADAVRREEQEYLRAVKMKLKAEADFAKEIERRIKEREREEARANAARIRDIKAQVAAEKQAEKERVGAAKEAARERDRLNRDANALLKQVSRDEVRAAKEAEAEKQRAAKESFRAWKEEHMQKHRMAMQAWREEQEATKKNADQVGELVKSFINLQVVKDVAGWIKEAMQAAAQSVAEARDRVRGMADEMERARTASKEIAALRGKDATAGFTATMAREAASAGLDVEDYKQFSLGWEAYAGQYVADDIEQNDGESDKDFAARKAETLAKQGKKITKSQALELQKQVGAYAVGARGLGAEDASGLLGLIMAKSKAGASNDEILSNYAKMMKVAELAPGKTTPLLGQITELGMENVGPEGDMKSVLDAATLVRVMAQRNPAEAATFGRNLFQGLRKIRMDPDKMGELGITKDMGFREQIEAVDKAVRAHTAAGGDQGEFLSKYFANIRSWGAIQTAINEGIRGGAFTRAEREAATVDAGTVGSEIARHGRSEEGRAARDRSEEIAAARERSARYVELRHIQSEVRKAQIASGDLEIPESMIGAYMTGGAGAAFGMGSRQEQEERVETGRIMRERLLMSKEGRRWLIQHNPEAARIEAKFPSPDMAEERRRAEFSSRGMFGRDTGEHFLAEAANELKRIREIQEKEREANEKRRAVAAAPPLVAPPLPGGAAR